MRKNAKTFRVCGRAESYKTGNHDAAIVSLSKSLDARPEDVSTLQNLFAVKPQATIPEFDLSVNAPWLPCASCLTVRALLCMCVCVDCVRRECQSVSCSVSRALLFHALLFHALLFRALSFRALLFRALLFRALLFRALLFRVSCLICAA